MNEAPPPSTSNIQTMSMKKGCVLGDPRVAWSKEGRPGNKTIFYVAIKVAEDEEWMTLLCP